MRDEINADESCRGIFVSLVGGLIYFVPDVLGRGPCGPCGSGSAQALAAHAGPVQILAYILIGGSGLVMT